MNAIPMYEFQKLSSAMTRCKITSPQGKISYILDRKNEKVGEINWNNVSISIYEEYEYCNEVLDRLGKFTDVNAEFEQPDVPIEFNEGEPELTDRGKLLYEKPRKNEKEMVDEVNAS